MKAGLLGAIGGLGEAMQTVGKDIQKRREEALENARELAKEQRRQAIRGEERAQDRGLRIDLAEATDRRIREEGEATRGAAATRQAQSQAFTKSQNEWKAANNERLIGVRDQYARSRTAAAQANAAAIDNGQVVDAYTTGRPVKRPDGAMREQILHELGDGTIVETGQWVKPGTKLSPPKNRRGAAKRGSMMDSLDLDEDEEEDE